MKTKMREGIPFDHGKFNVSGTYANVGQNLTELQYNQWSDAKAIAAFSSVVMTQPSIYLPYYITPQKQIFSSTTFPLPRYNECHNIKGIYVFDRPAGWIYKPSGVWYHAATGPLHQRWPFGEWATLIQPLIKANGVPDSARSRAWASLQPRFESDFSTLNFLWELKDFKNLAKLIYGTSARGLDGNLFTYLKNVGRSSVKEKALRNLGQQRNLTAAGVERMLSKNVSSLWLQYTMAYLPLMKDIAAFSAAIACDVVTAQNKFSDAGLTKQKRHYSEYLTDNSTLVSTSSVSSGSWELWKKAVVKYTASMEYSYSYTMRSTRDAFVKYWGLTGSADNFWNAIPWSFLIDYFISIGKTLEMMQNDPNVDLRVLQYCESVLSDTSVAMHLNPQAKDMHFIVIDGKLATKLTPVHGFGKSEYHRTLTAPRKIGMILPKFKLPSQRQWMNIAALLRQLF